MFTSINEFKKSLLIVEDTIANQNTTLNSDKNTSLTEYENDLKYYNLNKAKLIPILLKDVTQQEVLANKLINGNIFLGIQWKFNKLDQVIKKDEDKLKSDQISDEEKKQVQTDIADNKNKLILLKKELDEKIKGDLNTIKTM